MNKLFIVETVIESTLASVTWMKENVGTLGDNASGIIDYYHDRYNTLVDLYMLVGSGANTTTDNTAQGRWIKYSDIANLSYVVESILGKARGADRPNPAKVKLFGELLAETEDWLEELKNTGYQPERFKKILA